MQYQNLLVLLESRRDDLVYRLGYASTRRAGRQLVNHGHITVDGKKVDIPSYRVKPGQTIALKEQSKDLKVVKDSLAKVLKRAEFVKFNDKDNSGVYVRVPARSELNPEINEALVVEFYNR